MRVTARLESYLRTPRAFAFHVTSDRKIQAVVTADDRIANHLGRDFHCVLHRTTRVDGWISWHAATTQRSR
jgi:hypothetical protein